MIKKFIKENEKYSIFVSILMIILSIYIICNPIKSMKLVIICFGTILIINGIGSFIAYFTSDKESRLYSFGLLECLIYLLAGILILTNRLVLVEFLPIILGVWIVISNLFKLQMSINLSTINGSGWIGLLFMSILMILLGIICITRPFDISVAITTLVGLILLISEIINLIESIYVMNKIDKI